MSGQRDKLSATIKATIAGTEYKLRLTIGDIEAIEDALDGGLMVMLRRWQVGDYRVKELRVVLEQALRSGGNKVSTDEVRAMISMKALAEVVSAVTDAIYAGIDLGPTEAVGEA